MPKGVLAFLLPTKNEIIESLYRNTKIDACINRFVRADQFDDFKQEIFCIILAKPDSYIKQKHSTGELIPIVKGVIKKQATEFTENRRDFIGKYKPSGVELTGTVDVPHDPQEYEYRLMAENCDEIIDKEFNSMDDGLKTFYFRELINLVLKHGSQAEVARLTNIPKQRISDHVRKVREHLKTIICDNPDASLCLPCLGMGVPARLD